MGSHNSNRRAPRKVALFSPDRYRPRHAVKAKYIGRISARTSVSAGLLMMSVAGSASPLAMASTNSDSPAPVPVAGAAPVAVPAAPVLGPPSTWIVTAPAPFLYLPGSPEPPAKPAPDPAAVTPAADPAPAPRPAPAPEVFDRHGDQLADWINDAIRAMRAQGVPVDAGNVEAIRTVIDKESNGNPSAVNRWDSNWRAGHPSKGLMQCIDSTFNAHKLPGHDDIFNPVDNIIAGVRYTISRYGGFDNHPGLKSILKGKGYRGY